MSVEPGSLKCTWVSIHPGKTISSFASKVSFDDSSIESSICAIFPSNIPISFFSSFPSIKQSPFLIIRSNIFEKSYYIIK